MLIRERGATPHPSRLRRDTFSRKGRRGAPSLVSAVAPRESAIRHCLERQAGAPSGEVVKDDRVAVAAEGGRKAILDNLSARRIRASVPNNDGLRSFQQGKRC